MSELYNTDTDKSKQRNAILAGINTSQDNSSFERSMDELSMLAKACGLSPVATLTQNASEITQSTLVGSGKVDELKNAVNAMDADIVIFNQTLSPMQIRNLERALDTEVIDRTGLILLIFSLRAGTREAKLQVEYARLQYLLPRLSGMRTDLSRQGGGSGRLSNKGAGETKLELDKRHIEHRMSELRKELSGIDRERETQRSRRNSSGLPVIALAGYTNAGKSTIMNSLLRLNDGNAKAESKQVMEKDMLFATLDTSVRNIAIAGHRQFLLSDTVGFIDELPHTLVKAFRSTLEEVCRADLLIEVIDYSDPDHMSHMNVTDNTLAEIGAGGIPRLYLFNKTDIVMQNPDANENSVLCPPEFPYSRGSRIYMSARDASGVKMLLDLIDSTLDSESIECTLLIPYDQGSILNELSLYSTIISREYLPEGVSIKAKCIKREYDRLKKYVINGS